MGKEGNERPDGAAERRLCPTRPEGAPPLIAQSIAPDTCFERQRRLYHKCFACAYRGVPAGSVPVAAPPASALAPPPPPRSAAQRE